MLGPGGFGITYLARSLRLDRDVALKEYFPVDFAVRDGSNTIRSLSHGSGGFFSQGKQHFIAEARVLAKFQHEHIVRVINWFEANNTAYMVLEFEEGRSFKQWLQGLGRKPTQAEIDAILYPMLLALEAIHSKGIFHRDIAPDNIMLRPNGKPVLIDFGAARQFARERSQTLGAIVKHGYSPPEQYTVDTKLQGAWSDIYSLCATMCHAVLGQPPQEASQRLLQDSTLPIEDKLSAADLRRYRESFLNGLNAGLALRPKDRPQNVSELRLLLFEGADTHPLSEPRRSGGALQPASPARQVALSLLDQRGEEHSAGLPFSAAAARTAGTVALGVSVLSALGFVALNGTTSAAGWLALVLACLGAAGASLERVAALRRCPSISRELDASAAAAVLAAALATLWFAQMGPVLAGPLLVFGVLACAFAFVRYGTWVPVALVGAAIVQVLLVLDAVVENIDRGGTSLPILMSAYVIISVAALFAASIMWTFAAPPAGSSAGAASER